MDRGSWCTRRSNDYRRAENGWLDEVTARRRPVVETPEQRNVLVDYHPLRTSAPQPIDGSVRR